MGEWPTWKPTHTALCNPWKVLLLSITLKGKERGTHRMERSEPVKTKHRWSKMTIKYRMIVERYPKIKWSDRQFDSRVWSFSVARWPHLKKACPLQPAVVTWPLRLMLGKCIKNINMIVNWSILASHYPKPPGGQPQRFFLYISLAWVAMAKSQWPVVMDKLSSSLICFLCCKKKEMK